MIKKWLIIVMIILPIALFPAEVLANYEAERTDGGCFSLVDEEGRVLDQTALMVNRGDEFIAPDNRKYKVVKINGDQCICAYAGMEKMPQVAAVSDRSGGLFGLTAVLAKTPPTIGVYHTHSDESYVPSDGTESKNGRGGIYQVGRQLVDRLRTEGFKIDYNRNVHLPHDPNAYYRSRRTAVQLLKSGSGVLIDVHRDSTPPSVYKALVQGIPVTKVKLVVGRQNPHMASNLEFAKRIKSAMDKKYPGLAGGIFIGKGNYNQDLTPRAMLIEVGAHTNSKLDAENGVKLFAGVIPAVVGMGSGSPYSPVASTGGQRSDWGAALALIVVVAAGYGVYYLINRRSPLR